MDVDFETTIEHIVESFGSFEETSCKIYLIKVVNREMNCFNASCFVVFKHLWQVDTSMVDIHICLNIENACDTCILHCLSIFFELWIWANKDACCTYLIKSKSSNKVSISHLNMTIDDENFVDISPDIISLLSKFPSIIIRILNIQDSAWFSLPDSGLFDIIPDKILVNNFRWTYAMLELH